jgi:hypothetical protein
MYVHSSQNWVIFRIILVITFSNHFGLFFKTFWSLFQNILVTFSNHFGHFFRPFWSLFKNISGLTDARLRVPEAAADAAKDFWSVGLDPHQNKMARSGHLKNTVRF